ncbi:MAG: L-seryl-tRNA(Sec) selenium transferase, partial [Roseiflexaceae bacterium]
MTSAYRQLPAVETLVQAIQRSANGNAQPHELLVDAARAELDAARSAIADGAAAPSIEQLIDTTLARSHSAAQPSLRPLINATGVIIQTNLGRAPLSEAALQAMHEVGMGYSNLEYDLAAGERGSRAAHLGGLLCRLTGAEAALAVN